MFKAIHPKIDEAHTLESLFYKDSGLFEQSKDKIFAKSWHWTASTDQLSTAGQTWPYTLLDGFLNEPLLITRDQADQLHVLSNVCTHRGNILVEHPCKLKKILCNYHGRRFDLSGKFEFMPEFKDAKNFPTACDDLPKVPWGLWADKFIFTSIEPAFPLESIIKPLQERLYFLDLTQLRFDSTRSRDYLVQSHWALYVDNYLEGLHIPFVHPGLNSILDYGTYQTEQFEYGNLQIGYGKTQNDAFVLPKRHPDFGQNVAAYYYWFFPNLMLNFYPWGLSVNVIRPLNTNLCKVSFLTYILDETKLGIGAGAELDKVEREDEAVVENVQRGIMSRFYQKGRYSPYKEQNLHQFHSLIARFMLADFPKI
ncbi:MAG: aromatic ring-hydroxylating dioxygenase subunit alpha [Cytophagales bacterium]|nr:MAG: aromatic ring-hydroxylating dioxygenase subunit alpha [Cytophagales bacterium]TAF59863.1 MAG: aromatic ring-hydroxylating dioxygenase subunit alpha [Cytophagales bacterium]